KYWRDSRELRGRRGVSWTKFSGALGLVGEIRAPVSGREFSISVLRGERLGSKWHESGSHRRLSKRLRAGSERAALQSLGAWTRRPYTSTSYASRWMCSDARRRIKTGTASRPRARAAYPGAAAQTRVVSRAGIRLDSRKSVRPFKGIICDDIS